MSIKLLVRQGGGAAAQPDIANLGGNEGAPIFDGQQSLIEMGHRWEQGTASRGAFTSLDPEALLTYKFRPHASVKLIEDDSGSDVILAWHRIEGGNDVGREWPGYTPGDAVKHISVQTMDANLDLRGIPFKNTWSRPAEDSWERLQALHAAKLNGSASTADIHRSTTNITVDRFSNGHLVDATSPVELEAKDYPAGTHVEEILTDIMGQWGKGWGITIHHDGGSHKCLLVQDYDDLAKFTSDLRISDQLADWDPTDLTAPVLEPIWRRAAGKTSDNSDTISGLITVYGGTADDPRHLYVETGEAPEDWELWVDTFHDDLAQNATQAERRAENILEDRKRPYITNQPSILLLPEQVTLITAGQAIEVKSVVMNQGADKHNWVWRRIAEVRWEPNYDGRWWAHLELDRPRNSHPASGSGQPKSTTPKPAPEEDPQPPGTLTELVRWSFTTNSNDDTNVYGSGGAWSPAGNEMPGVQWDGGFSTIPNGGGRTGDVAVTPGNTYNISLDHAWKYDPSIRDVFVYFQTGPQDSGTAIETNLWLDGSNYAMRTEYHTSTNFVAPALAEYIRIGWPNYAGLQIDNLVISEVDTGTEVENDPDAVDYGDCPHASTHWLPSDFVLCRLQQIQEQINTVSSNAVGWESLPEALEGGIYLASAFHPDDESLYILTSEDGKDWSVLHHDIYNPGTEFVRDPSLLIKEGTWWVVHTRGPAGGAFGVTDSFGVASSTDGEDWVEVADVSLTAITGIDRAWAPQWFVDEDGDVHVFISVSTDDGATFTFYETHPTNAAMTTWSAPVDVGIGTNYIDAFVVRKGQFYYLWAKNETTKFIELFRSSSLTSGYSLIESGDWAGWGDELEGPSLVKVDADTWRIYLDSYNTDEIYYSESSDDWATWSAKTVITAPFYVQHPHVIHAGGPIEPWELAAGTRDGTKFLRDDMTWQTVSAAADLDDLGDVVITSPAADDMLQYNGGEWVNSSRRWEPVTFDPGGGPEILFTATDVVMTWKEY